MKTIYLLSVLLSVTFSLHAQYGTGIGTTTPDESAELDIVSPNSNTGVILSVMSELEMNAIASPVDGLLVYNTDRGKYMYYIKTATTTIWAVVGELPILTGPEISALLGAPSGMMIYNTTTSSVWYFNSVSWSELSDL